MLKQLFNQMKNTLSILLVFFVIISMTASAASALIVTPTTPIITWKNPANITYGTALSSTQLDATASVPGTFVYKPPAGTILDVGSDQKLSTTFTPTDTINYTATSASVLINVSIATPTITWSIPTDICQGMPLSYGDQLNASASNSISGAIVPGTFYYNPDVGTVLSAGNQTLHVDFTPATALDYTNASETVYINVTQCTKKHGFFHQNEYSTFLPFQWG